MNTFFRYCFEVRTELVWRGLGEQLLITCQGSWISGLHAFRILFLRLVPLRSPAVLQCSPWYPSNVWGGGGVLQPVSVIVEGAQLHRIFFQIFEKKATKLRLCGHAQNSIHPILFGKHVVPHPLQLYYSVPMGLSCSFTTRSA